MTSLANNELADIRKSPGKIPETLVYNKQTAKLIIQQFYSSKKIAFDNGDDGSLHGTTAATVWIREHGHCKADLLHTSPQ